MNSMSKVGMNGRRSRMILSLALLAVVLSTPVLPGFQAAQAAVKPQSQFDDGLTDEERELVTRPIAELSEKDEQRRNQILDKLRDHIIRIMNEKEQAKRATQQQASLLPSSELRPTEMPSSNTQPPVEPEGNRALSFDQRLYSFNLRDGSYIDLVSMFASKTGLPVSDLPIDCKPETNTITYVSTELTSFTATLQHINDLLASQVTPPLHLYYDAINKRLTIQPVERIASAKGSEEGKVLVSAQDQSKDEAGENRIDRPVPNEPQQKTLMVTLQHAQAELVAEQLNLIVNRGQSAAPSNDQRNTDTLRVIPEPRTNSLILRGPEDMLALGQKLVREMLDKDEWGKTNGEGVPVQHEMREFKETAKQRDGEVSEQKQYSAYGPDNPAVQVPARAPALGTRSSASEYVSKTFTLKNADAKEVADLIIAVLDEPTARGTTATEGNRDDNAYFAEPIGPYSGRTISVWPKSETGTLIVYAPSSRMSAIETLIADCEHRADVRQVQNVATESHSLKYLDSTQAVKMTQEYVATRYPSATPVNVVSADDSTVVITGNQKHVAEIHELITEKVDTKEQLQHLLVVDSVRSFLSNFSKKEALDGITSYLNSVDVERSGQRADLFDLSNITEIE